MRTYANLHVALEQMRVSALSHIRGISVPPREKSNWDPPRVLVVGPEHSGKTTVCKILTNYAVRAGQNWSPYFVNVDPSEVRCWFISKASAASYELHWKGGWACPGALSVSPVHGPIATGSPANPLGSAATTAPMALASNALLPLVYWYGHPEITRNPLLMDRLIRNLGENMSDRFEHYSEGVLSILWSLTKFYSYRRKVYLY